VRPPSRTAVIALARNDFYEQLSCTLSITTQFLCGVVSVASADGKGNGFADRGSQRQAAATHWGGSGEPLTCSGASTNPKSSYRRAERRDAAIPVSGEIGVLDVGQDRRR
jgi:hypothetical protein